ncbi:PspA/IM30 family protein [Romboutsia sp. 1001216sp1]|uniref:PspA/IM30 family protein n=1 Tax=Romboutsia sp. 1001216sp1 TaxID=2986997 RepID=UPI00232B87C1|nr:PspA/IM30 family protein [Romboutsia sp. 1001216sp1]MDB8803779.1 PspA/IM30 family protein [Romboutsia sp. 1001216sp1]MDB8806871.1 PspA/IM30 family protein [Romboutsia sp. 1001216sp1]MDB8809426.1 PspA/IM30 family protein [Romboutsia sp. 1001216sp1]MDB8815175.1 PspA/IM30 family protein [Romboutsia sp. 1001216sp1]MDB8817868.1 PspA/IM30 family protein [Romboutsia sp. 1001216sp1]
MSFFKKLKNIVDAKANKALDKHENPIEMLELSITKKEKLLQDAKKQCANFIASVDGIRNEKKDIQEKIDKYEEATKVAIQKEDNEKAQNFVKQKLELQGKLTQTEARIKEQDEKIQLVKNKISDLEIEISKMKSKKQELATRLDVAEINNDINETLAGLNDDHGINLDELEKKVAQKESYGKALEDLKPKDEDELLDEYISSSPSVDDEVAKELERIKEQMKK